MNWAGGGGTFPLQILADTSTCLQYHIVFSTKHREPWIRPEIEERLQAYLGGIAREKIGGNLSASSSLLR